MTGYSATALQMRQEETALSKKKKKKTALIILSNSFKRPMSKQNEPFLSMPSKKTHECFVMRHPMSEQHCLSV